MDFKNFVNQNNQNSQNPTNKTGSQKTESVSGQKVNNFAGGKPNSNFGSNSQQQGGQKNDAIKEEKIKQTTKKFEGKSEDELMSEILRQAKAGKSSGQLSPQQIDEFYNNVSPMLSREQRRKLEGIIGKIR